MGPTARPEAQPHRAAGRVKPGRVIREAFQGLRAAAGVAGRVQDVRDLTLIQRDPTLIQRDPTLIQRDPTLIQRDLTLIQRDPTLIKHDPTLIQGDPTLIQRDLTLIQRDSGATYFAAARRCSVAQREEALGRRGEVVVRAPLVQRPASLDSAEG